MRAVILLAVALPVLAQAAQPSAWDLQQQGQAAEDAGKPVEALRLYQESLAADTSSPVSRISRARIDWLQARSQNSFEDLAELQRLRAIPSSTLGDDQLTTFAARVRTWPAGALRLEARQWISDAWVRKGRLAQARDAYRELLADSAIGPAERQLAATRLASLETDSGAPQRGLEVLRQQGLQAIPAYRSLRAMAILHVGHPIAVGVLVMLLLTTALCLRGAHAIDALRRALAPNALATMLFVVLPPALLGGLYDSGQRPLFLWLGVLLFLVLVCTTVASRALRLRQARTGSRALLALLSCAASLAAGFLALEHSEMLTSFLGATP